MTENNTQPNTEQKAEVKPVAPVAATHSAQIAPHASVVNAEQPRRDRNDRNSRGGDRKPRREPRARSEFDQKIIDIRRVTRVSSGGRRFSFAVTIVAGDKKGRVGVGTGKGSDTALAVEKAFRNAKKNLITINMTKTNSIAHEVDAKYSSSRVEIQPAPGKGMAAGSSVRDVLILAGIKDVVAKLRSGTKNKLNNAMAAVTALKSVKKPRPSHKVKAQS
ncbi:MAG: 30S ribosomal protein S5 [bacterium]